MVFEICLLSFCVLCGIANPMVEPGSLPPSTLAYAFLFPSCHNDAKCATQFAGRSQLIYIKDR